MTAADTGGDAFDFVIVGAGSAGCVLASRLSERPGNRVLLIEAGRDYPPGREPPEILDTFAATAYSNPRFIWPNVTARFAPRPSNAPDRRPRRVYNQGRVIGGTSSINGMASNRGLPWDYDNWAALGATGWDWDGVLPYFRKLETDDDFDGPLHGKDGPIRLQRFRRGRPGRASSAASSRLSSNTAGRTSTIRMPRSATAMRPSRIAIRPTSAWERRGAI